MALNELRIIVVNGGGSGGNGSASGIKKEKTVAQFQKEKNQKLSKAIKSFSNPVDAAVDKITGKMSPSAALVTTMAVNLGVSFLKQSFNYHISNIGRSAGDSNYQAIVGRQLEIVSDNINTISSVLSGAAAGAAIGGFAGAAVGAVTGGISAGISIGFRQAERQRAYDYELFKQNNTQSYNLSRANYSLYNGRVR